MMKAFRPIACRPGGRTHGFTLVEILASLAVGCLLLLSVALIAVMSAKVMRKNVLAHDAVTATRLFQEHLNKEITMAVWDSTRLALMPQYAGGDPSPPDPLHPRNSRLTYRIFVGSESNAVVVSGGLMGDLQMTLNCPVTLTPQIGDYVMLDKPDFGMGAKIINVTDTRTSGLPGPVAITLAQTVAASTTGVLSNVSPGVAVNFQRQRAYQTADSAKYPGLVEMRWYMTTASTTPPLPGDTEPYLVITSNVAPSSRFPFIKVDGPSATPEPAVGWEFTYAPVIEPIDEGQFIGGKTGFYEANHTEGLIMPKSGNPKAASSIIGTPAYTPTSTSTSTSTATTSTTSTTSTKTTTTSTTSTSSTSTSTTSTTTTSTTTTSTTSTKTTTSTSTSTSTSTKTSTSTSISTSTIDYDG